jgi:hypothetical protein
LNAIWQTMVQHWDGSSWQVVQTPNANPAQDNVLEALKCNSATDCWTVGYFNAGDVNNPLLETLIEHWDGSSWTIVTSPNRSEYQFNFLYGITCLSGSECWSVGVSDTPNAITLVEHYQVSPVQLTAIVSRKTHNDAGVFDVDLTNSIECRSGGANGDYKLVFSFANPLTTVAGANVTFGTGSVVSAQIDPSDAHNYIVNLTGVANAQSITVSLTNVGDSVGNFSPAAAGSMKVLIGDTNGDGFVNSADIGQTKSQSGNQVTGSDFREDVNADGFVNSADIGLVKSKSGTGLP